MANEAVRSASAGRRPRSRAPLSVDLSRFRDGFLEEADEHAAALETLALERSDVDAMFRAAHSIKGGCGMFALPELGSFTHVLESVLDRARDGELALDDDAIAAILSAVDAIRTTIAGYRRGDDRGAPFRRESEALLRALLGRPAGGAPLTTTLDAPRFCVRFTCASDPRRETTYVAVEDAVRRFARVESAARERETLVLTVAAPEVELRDVFAFVLDTGDELSLEALDAAVTPAPPAPIPGFGFFDDEDDEELLDAPREAPTPSVAGVESASIRVALAKVDALVNLVGELVMAQASLENGTHGYDPIAHAPLLAAVESIARHTRELREGVMAMRMVPIRTVFGRFPRLVHDIAAKLGKSVDLRLVGEDTELDKSVVEQLVDPLTHLVRNAIDHGIEPEDERIAAGKPARGTIVMRAAHLSGNVVVEIVDDGRGLDRERILAKARERGLRVAEDASDAEVWSLIFAPGFSTAAAVTDLSGRGVGLDVVQRNINALSGRIDVRATPGAGTTFTIRLPLTLAIVDGLSVRVGPYGYVVPLANIVELLQADVAPPTRLGPDREVIFFREEPVPLRRLPGTQRGEIVVVVEEAGRRAAVLVDTLEGQQQVVIKSIETNFRKVEGVAGATVSGDGSIALILDVAKLVA